MLQVNIKHEENDETIRIATLYDDDTLLKEFNEETRMIDVEVCRPFIGSEIRVHHHFTDKNKNYTIKGLLQEVITDPVTKIKSIKFQAMEEG